MQESFPERLPARSRRGKSFSLQKFSQIAPSPTSPCGEAAFQERLLKRKLEPLSRPSRSFFPAGGHCAASASNSSHHYLYCPKGRGGGTRKRKTVPTANFCRRALLHWPNNA